MEVDLITIGDEILIGQTIDTNSAWMAKQFNSLGIKIRQITSIKDERDAIISQIDNSLQSSNFVITTGGLGPTKDDITKHVLCEYFETNLVRNKQVLQRIESFFSSRGRAILEVNRQQADLPEDCTVLDNRVGTASGMWFEKEGKVLVSLPGVPYEMKHLMQSQVLPRIKQAYQLPAIYHHTIMTEGVGESFLADRIKDWEASLDQEQIKIAYLPSPGVVKIRLTAEGEDAAKLEEKVSLKAAELEHLVPEYIFGVNDIKSEEAIANELINRGFTVATAESCTGGYLAHLFTTVPGSSAYFMGSVVSYANQIKSDVLGVDEQLINDYGAVSEQVVEQMANHVRLKMNVDFALATSGVAGPDGGSEEKPVGTVWIAIASKDGVYSKKYMFEKNRERNIHRASLAAISLLRRALNGQLEIRS